MRVAAYSAGPQGGAATRPELQNAPPDANGFSFELEDGPATAAIATPVVNWRDRELERGTFGLDQTGIARTYHFVVHLKKGVSNGVDFTFQSGYFFAYAVGAPNYESNPPAVPGVATFEQDEVDQADSSTDSDGGGDVPWPIVLMLFGGGAIFGVIGVVALNRSRRRSSPVKPLTAGPPWPLVFILVIGAAVLTVVGLVLLARIRGGRS